MADVLTKVQRSYCMSRIKGRDTKPEVKLRKALWRIGLRYRVCGKITGKPDLIFSKKKVAVFIDGCFWHGCPQHCKMPESNSEFWEKKIKGNVHRDRNAEASLSASGWTVLRFWEHQVKNDLDTCVELIRKTVRK